MNGLTDESSANAGTGCAMLRHNTLLFSINVLGLMYG